MRDDLHRGERMVTKTQTRFKFPRIYISHWAPKSCIINRHPAHPANWSSTLRAFDVGRRPEYYFLACHRPRGPRFAGQPLTGPNNTDPDTTPQVHLRPGARGQAMRK